MREENSPKGQYKEQYIAMKVTNCKLTFQFKYTEMKQAHTHTHGQFIEAELTAAVQGVQDQSRRT